MERGNLELNPEKRSRLARRDRTVVSGSTLPGKVIIFSVFVKHWIKRTPENSLLQRTPGYMITEVYGGTDLDQCAHIRDIISVLFVNNKFDESQSSSLP